MKLIPPFRYLSLKVLNFFHECTCATKSGGKPTFLTCKLAYGLSLAPASERDRDGKSNEKRSEEKSYASRMESSGVAADDRDLDYVERCSCYGAVELLRQVAR